MKKSNLIQFQEYKEAAFTKRIVHKEADNVIFILNFTPNAELPTHNHPGANVYLLVLEGSGTVTVNGEETEVVQGDMIHITGDEHFSYRGGAGANSSLHVVLTKTPSESYAQNV
ncbi:cupin domain-containing protein [Paenibacillus sp. P2(2022)]|uniref:cupin domain-containing protein n=1 Tax=Paenibacillus TaxID=44249 RepID=UPI0004DFCAF0|nr:MULTISPECIES: cupin domain-containing protein [Paenibacillus]MBY7738123.1 cupin domain-containing protein [Paenibacillus polymyxa]MDG0054716.1 cupin domain-containing protein [Paenibacillus sp. P2(2022)]WOZ38316.1 cupin domain-containing protein [Paenibacillus polymyxa]